MNGSINRGRNGSPLSWWGGTAAPADTSGRDQQREVIAAGRGREDETESLCGRPARCASGWSAAPFRPALHRAGREVWAARQRSPTNAGYGGAAVPPHSPPEPAQGRSGGKDAEDAKELRLYGHHFAIAPEVDGCSVHSCGFAGGLSGSAKRAESVCHSFVVLGCDGLLLHADQTFPCVAGCSPPLNRVRREVRAARQRSPT
jgi:hypothetical protein